MSKENKKTAAEQQQEEIKEEAAAEETVQGISSEEVQPGEECGAKDAGKEPPREPKPGAEEELAALNDKYLRICAEYDNFRKRSQKEKEGLYADIKAETLKKFLPVYDNLVRALAQPTEDEAYKKGVEMIMTQFNSTMEKLGVTEIESQGQKFDPALHNAVMHVDDEEKGENEIVEVFQKGFKMGEKVIRFAMVKVAN